MLDRQNLTALMKVVAKADPSTPSTYSWGGKSLKRNIITFIINTILINDRFKHNMFIRTNVEQRCNISDVFITCVMVYFFKVYPHSDSITF